MRKTAFVIGENVRMDIQRLVDTRLLIQANSGAGKSWCLRRILEQTHGALQHLVIDPEGEFSSLRERFDYVLAAKSGGETAADPRAARLLAERLLELGVSAILDIYELKATKEHPERVQFVKNFLEAVVDAPKKLWHPALIIIDEAHVFAPEKGESESAGPVIDLATRGRKRGFCAVMATQRLSKLRKDAAAELNNKLIGRCGLDVDLKRAADELGLEKKDWPRIRSLKEGHFFAFGPAISNTIVQVYVGEVKTTHPKAGARLAFTAPPPTEKVRALLPKLADLPAESEQKKRTEQEMRREITSLKRELARKPQPKAASPAKPKVVEKPVLKDSQIRALDATAKKLDSACAQLNKRTKEIADALKLVANGHGREVETRRPQHPKPPTDWQPAQRREAIEPFALKFSTNAVSKSKQRILDALAFLEGIGVHHANKTQLALLADASPTSGGYFNNLGSLRSDGLISYPGPSLATLTPNGRALANVESVPATSEELHQQIARKLPVPKWKILNELIQLYPDPISKEQLAKQIGVSPTSGGYFNNLGSLRSLGLIEYPTPGQAVALPVLFLDC